MFYFITHKPIDDITNTVSSEFGKRFPPKAGATSQHQGIDFNVPIGTRLYAAHKGVVIKKDLNDPNGGGKVIEIRTTDDQGNQYSTRYLHLSEFKKITDKTTGELREIEKDDEVEGGDQIAFSGNTGSASSGAHLHFTVVVNGEKQNPREYLANAFPREFSTTVKSGNYGVELTGDFRDNLLIANIRSNILSGLEGFNTYNFPTFKGLDQIIDSDGTIQLNGNVISGNALPETDKSGNKIADSWVFAEYGLKLKKVGSDLEITSSKPKSDTAQNKIIVKDFPFSNSQGAFRITLGKKKDLTLGDDVYSLSLTNSYLPQGAFAAASSDKGLFAPLAMLDSQGSELPVSHSIGVFDSFGNQLATHDVESVVKSSADSEMLTPDIGTGIKIGAGYSSGGYALFPISELGYIDGGSLQSRVGSHF